jgi:hypothetical protein
MDPILARFLEKQAVEGAALAQASDLLQIQPLVRSGGPAQHFIARFGCQGFVRLADREVVKHDCFDVGIYFPDNYLREASTYQVLTWLAPANIFHPNIGAPFICVGERFLRPGTPLVEVLFQLHAVISYRKWASHAGLNPDACQWAVNHQHLFPADSRPLKRRKLQLEVELTSAGEGQGS